MAFTAGLLQDIGELVIGGVLTVEMVARMRERVESGAVSRIEAEREVLATDHAEVGANLLKSWNVPDEIVEAVANHHQPVMSPVPQLSVVTHMADCLAHLTGGAPGWGSYAVRISPQVVEALNLDSDRLDALIVTTRESIERTERFMSGL